MLRSVAAACVLWSGLCAQAAQPPTARPNIVLIITDDQGMGDLSITGNPHLETPAIDALARQSVSFTRFYVSPVCSPTRASLMTGRYNYRTRVVDTWVGRSSMEPDEVTLAEVLSAAGYRTVIFGKWHLGDCYPLRPNDQGFDEVPKKYRKFYRRWGGSGDTLAPNEVLCPVCKVVIRSVRELRPGDRVYCMACMARLRVVRDEANGWLVAEVEY